MPNYRKLAGRLKDLPEKNEVDPTRIYLKLNAETQTGSANVKITSMLEAESTDGTEYTILEGTIQSSDFAITNSKKIKLMWDLEREGQASWKRDKKLKQVRKLIRIAKFKGEITDSIMESYLSGGEDSKLVGTLIGVYMEKKTSTAGREYTQYSYSNPFEGLQEPQEPKEETQEPQEPQESTVTVDLGSSEEDPIF